MTRSYAKMDILMDKLRVLDYELHYLQNNNESTNLPLNRDYFAITDNEASMTKFHQFSLLSSWLFNTIRENSFVIDEFDDPTMIIKKMNLELKILGYEVEHSDCSIKMGSGEAVLDVLTFLVDQALGVKQFRFEEPIYPESVRGSFLKDDDMAITFVQDFDEDNNSYFLDSSGDDSMNGSSASATQIIEAKVDKNQWMMELERIAPQLKAAENKADQNRNDWRVSFNQRIVLEKTIEETSNILERRLHRFSYDLINELNKIEAQEKAVNAHFNNENLQLQKIKQELVSMEKRKREYSTKLAHLSDEKKRNSEKLKELNKMVESRGNQMTNTSQIIKIKDALRKVKQEIKNFSKQIAILDSTMMRFAVKGLSRHAKTNEDQNFESSSDASSSFESSSSTSSNKPLQ